MCSESALNLQLPSSMIMLVYISDLISFSENACLAISELLLILYNNTSGCCSELLKSIPEVFTQMGQIGPYKTPFSIVAQLSANVNVQIICVQ